MKKKTPGVFRTPGSFVGGPLQANKNIPMKAFEKNKILIMSIYRASKIKIYFSLKEKCSHLFDCNIVYKFTCPNNNDITYIDGTGRQLCKCIDKHNLSDKNSVVFNHIYEWNTCQNFHDLNYQFKIFKKC